MSRRHLAALTAGAALATVLVGATGATASASTPRPAAASSPAGSSYHGCPYGYLCVHFWDVYTGKYHWTNYYHCKKYSISKEYEATWEINNQTPGTYFVFYYPDGDQWSDVYGPPSRSDVPEIPAYVGPIAVKPC